MTEIRFALAPGQNAFFHEIAEALRFELEAIGVDSSVHEGELLEPSPGAVSVILPPHEYARLAPGRVRPSDFRGAICICAEQPESPWFGTNLRFARAADAVFDLNRRGVDAMRRIGIRGEHLQLGYTRRWDRFSTSPRDIDVAFLGSSTPRRDRLLAAYAERLWRRRAELVISDNRRPNLETSTSFLAGDDKLRLLARSKLLLNIHREREPYFEWLRALEAIHCGALLVSERSSDCDPLLPGTHFFVGRAENLPQLVEGLLENEERCQAVAAEAYGFIRSELPMRPAAERLAAVAAEIAARRSRKPPARRLPPRAAPRRRPLAKRLMPLVEFGVAPITRLGQQVKEMRLEINEIQRKLDRLAYTAEHGSPPGLEIEVDNRPSDAEPKVTVVVTVWNYAHVVGAGLDSVARSDFTDLELVVVDDGSRDDSAETVRAWIGESSLPAALVRHSVNRGLPAARNTGIKQARGDYVLILDADNQLYPHCIDRFVAALEEDRDAAFAYGILERFDRSGPIGLKNKFGWDVQRLRRGNYIDALALIRRNVLDEIGGFCADVRLFGWEDYDLWCSIAALGMRGAHVREIVARYRVSPESMTSVIDLSNDVARNVIAERHPAVFAGEGPRSSTLDRIADQLA